MRPQEGQNMKKRNYVAEREEEGTIIVWVSWLNLHKPERDEIKRVEMSPGSNAEREIRGEQ